MRVLPASAAAPAEAMRRVQAQNPSDAAAMPDPELTATIAQACEAGERVRIEYRTEASSCSTRGPSSAPRPLVSARDLAGADARRVLRLDRIVGVTRTGERFTRPSDLDPVREVEEHLADGWTYDVEVRITAPFTDVRRAPRILGRLEATGEHSCVLRGSTGNPWWYAEQLAAIPGDFTVVAPEECSMQSGPSPSGSRAMDEDVESPSAP